MQTKTDNHFSVGYVCVV